MADKSWKQLHYYVLCVESFAEQKKMNSTEAFNYLFIHKGIDFLIDCYDAEHTLSINNAVEDLTRICKNNGGTVE